MNLRILSFFIEGTTWRVAQTSGGYFHRRQGDVPEWKAGIPSGISPEIVKSTFGQFSSNDVSLCPQTIKFKLTYRIGHSQTDCYIFSSSEGDLFSVKIPAATFMALQELFPTQTLPRMRVASLTVQRALAEGFPESELLPGSSLYEAVKAKIASAIPQKV